MNLRDVDAEVAEMSSVYGKQRMQGIIEGDYCIFVTFFIQIEKNRKFLMIIYEKLMIRFDLCDRIRKEFC